MRNLVIATIFAVVFVGCGDMGNPLSPTSINTLRLNPEVSHMKVGDSQIFTAEGGDGANYEFQYSNEVRATFNIERVNLNQIKMTYRKLGRVYATILEVKSGYHQAQATINLEN